MTQDTADAASSPESQVVSPAAKRNVLLLAACQALFFTGVMVTTATASLVGVTIAPDPKYATLPLALQILASLATTVPASLLMARFGRRAGFSFGIAAGILAALGATVAVLDGNFLLFCLCSAGTGIHQGFASFYRFAATDIAPSSYRPKAISYVLGGGVLAAFMGPELATQTRDWLAPIDFAGCYLAITILWVLPLIIIQFIQIPTPARQDKSKGGRPLREIAKLPAFKVAVLGAVFGYASMNFMMTATPLAMLACGFDFDNTATVIQWHVIGMFAPSFFTGHLIKRFGVLRIMAIGACLELVAATVALNGIAIENFMIALLCLGVGWNFLFVGGTTLITECHRPEERAKVQGFNDFTIFGLMAVSSFASGFIHDASGWAAIATIIVPGLIVTLVLVMGLGFRNGWHRPAELKAA